MGAFMPAVRCALFECILQVPSDPTIFFALWKLRPAMRQYHCITRLENMVYAYFLQNMLRFSAFS